MMDFEKWFNDRLEIERGKMGIEQMKKNTNGPDKKRIMIEIKITKELDREKAFELTETLSDMDFLPEMVEAFGRLFHADIELKAGIEND